MFSHKYQLFTDQIFRYHLAHVHECFQQYRSEIHSETTPKSIIVTCIHIPKFTIGFLKDWFRFEIYKVLPNRHETSKKTRILAQLQYLFISFSIILMFFGTKPIKKAEIFDLVKQFKYFKNSCNTSPALYHALLYPKSDIHTTLVCYLSL